MAEEAGVLRRWITYAPYNNRVLMDLALEHPDFYQDSLIGADRKEQDIVVVQKYLDA